MDQKARDAGYDEDQWEQAQKRALRWSDGIKELVLLSTIEYGSAYVNVKFKDGRHTIMALGVTDACVVEFPKCEVLSEVVFERRS